MPFPANALETVLAGLRHGTGTAEQLLHALADNTLWVPLPAGTGPDGTAQLPILHVDGKPYVAVYTSAEQLAVGAGDQAHMQLTGRKLAETIPAELGMAVNPGCPVGLPVRPEGVRALRGAHPTTVPAGTPVRLGEPDPEPHQLIDALTEAFRGVPAVLEARRALAQIGDQPPTLLIGIRPDRTRTAWRDETLTAVRDAARHDRVEVVFLDEHDTITDWLLNHTEPFYQRLTF